MVIDEPRNHVLKKYVTTKGQPQQIESDHNVLYGKFQLLYSRKQAGVKREIYNLKNKEAQSKFTRVTSVTNKFSSCYDANKSMEVNSNKFLKTLDDVFQCCFKKIRITAKSTQVTPSEIQDELKTISQLKLSFSNTACPIKKQELTSKLTKSEERVTNLMADKTAKLVTDQLCQLNTIDGNFNSVGMWKVKKKVLPRPTDPPMAKKDSDHSGPPPP